MNCKDKRQMKVLDFFAPSPCDVEVGVEEGERRRVWGVE